MVPGSEDGLATSAVPTTPDPTNRTRPSSEPPPTASHRADQQVGRYRLRALLGAGAMGEVWVATDPQLERDVAIKLVHPALARRPDVLARMVREARAMAKVSHRGVIAIHDAGEADGQLFLAMELVRGRTLGALLRGRRPDELHDWRRWLALAIDAGRGLAAAHAAGVMHRDFKPDNVMVDENGRVCVGDFGLATLGAAPEPSTGAPAGADTLSPALTVAGALLGTPIYMSLEQLRGEPIDPRADQFSFCVTAYEAIYGESPFGIARDEQANIVVLEESRVAPVRPPPADSHVPAGVRAIVTRGLAPSRNDRWPDLDTLLDALAAMLAPAKPRPRNRLVGAATGLALLVAAAGLWSLTRKHEELPAKLLGPVQTSATIDLSPGGKLAIATDRITLRDLEKGGDATTAPLVAPTWAWTRVAQFESDSVLRVATPWPGIMRWDFGHHLPPVIEPGSKAITGWLASMAGGDLVERLGPPDTLALVRGDRTLRAWALDAGWNHILAVSPSRQRFAYAIGDRFTQQIAVDDAAGHTWLSPAIADLAAVAWLDDRTLVYSSADTPALEAIDVDGGTPARTIYQLDSGFIGRIAVSSKSIVYMKVDPTLRVREIGRNPPSVRELEPSDSSSELGWTADGAIVSWNRATRALQRISPDTRHVTLPVKLDAEPANATFAGDLVLVAERSEGGRVLAAISLSTGDVAWTKRAGLTIAARCARDLVPPCYVAQRSGETYEIVPLDPRTGTTTGPPVYRGDVADFAISADGHRILVAEERGALLELDDGGARLARYDPPLIVRSVAYDPLGGMLLAGTHGGYVVGHYDGTTFTAFSVAADDLLSIVRASPTSDHVLAQGRSLTAALWQIPRP
ncbi:MAG TPA: serine/threonine-protein kinase [Kofleriaceae bacterium]|jgi:hypothetical protein